MSKTEQTKQASLDERVAYLKERNKELAAERERKKAETFSGDAKVGLKIGVLCGDDQLDKVPYRYNGILKCKSHPEDWYSNCKNHRDKSPAGFLIQGSIGVKFIRYEHIEAIYLN